MSAMLKKYLPFLVLGPVANLLWAFWALREINEQGGFLEMLQWICVQALLPVMLGLLLALKPKFAYGFLLVYSGFTILFALGILGWAFMGLGTPLSIYAVSAVLLVMGFGILFHTLKDSQWGQRVTRYETED